MTEACRSARSARDLGYRIGVSAIAVSMALVSGRAWAQAELTPIAPNTTQSAAPGQEQNAPDAGQAAGALTSQSAAPIADQGTTGAPVPGSEIVVTGRRAALEAADERKRRSETIIDSVVADDAGKLPDNSITEVLQRVSGVTIVRFAALNDPDHYSVEGSGIQVRGLTGVASRLNGRDIFSANNGRALSFADVTPELMAAVDVYKASTADLIEGGTGGQVDLRTKVPFDFKGGGFHVAATGEFSRGDLTDKTDGSGSVLVTRSFDTSIGRIGFLADYAYSRLSSTSNFFRMEPYFRQNIGGTDYFIPGGFDYGEEKFQRTRTGIYGAVQWAPTDTLTFTGTFFQSRYKNKSGDWGAQVTNQAMVVDPSASQFDANNLLISSPSVFSRDQTTFLPNGAFTSSGNKGAYRSTTTTRDYSLSGAWTPVDSPLVVRGSLQRVTSAQDYGRLDVFRDLTFPSGYALDLSGKLPQLSEPEGTQSYFDDPSNYFWSASMPHDEINRGVLKAAQLDLEYKFDDSFFKSVKVGGRVADRTERDQQNGYAWAALGRGWGGDPYQPQLTYANAAPGDVSQHVFKDFFHGGAELPGNLFFATDELARRYIGDRTGLTQAPPTGFCGDAGTALYSNCSASGPLSVTGYGGGAGVPALVPNDNETKTYAAYVLVRFGHTEGRGLSGNVGGRVVRIENTATGSILQNTTQFVRDGQILTLATATTPRDGAANFTRFLPSINFDYAPTDNTKLRFGYNITLDLPTFTELRAAGSIGVATTSNPANANPAPGAPQQPNIFTNYTTDAGNPLLKPTLSNNFDVSFEWYPHPGTSFHVAPFYKRLTNLPIYSLEAQVPISVVFADGTTEQTVASSTGYANADKAATVKGIELGGRFFFDMLPGLLSGFGFEGNYTFIDSSNPGDAYRDIYGALHNNLPLVGLSKHNMNATLLYEKGRVSARLAYSWRSKYLQSTTSNGLTPTYNYYSAPNVISNDSGVAGSAGQGTVISLPQYGAAYGQVEAGVRFKVNKSFDLSVQGTNIFNATTKTLQGGYPGGDMPIRSWFQTDRRISVGASLAF